MIWAIRILLAAGVVACGQDYFPPPDAQGGWRTRTAGATAQAKLEEAFEYTKKTTKHGGLLVVKDGWLIYERYFGMGHRDATPNTASVGKAFTSIAVGVLMGERPEMFPQGLDQEVFTERYFPAAMFPLSDPRKANIKLGQLLSMSAGIRGNNPGYVRGKEVILEPAGPDGAGAMRDAMAFGKVDGPLNTVTLWRQPGGGYSYATSSIHLASVMLRHITGRELHEYVEEKLARPTGWGRWGWGYKNNKLEHTPGGGGIAVRPGDMVRFGYLLLRGGRWGTRRLVPAEYVEKCGRLSPHNPHYPYSLQFNVNQSGHWKGLPQDAFWKTGSGGHCLYIVPSRGLVVWKMGGRDEQYDPANTGLDPARYDGSREGWKAGVDLKTDAPYAETLRLIVEAVR